jgi:uncharacterized protein (TIGR03663 family)
MSAGTTGLASKGSGWIVSLSLLAILLLAAAFRFADLEKRPFHGDEANQAVKAGMLLDDGEYRYDPHEHHGPTLYYLTLPVFWLTGTDAFVDTAMWQYRIVPAIFGLLAILLIWGLYPGISPGVITWAAVFTAVSHAFVYYNRYYIQESLLVFFALAAVVCGYRFMRSPGLGWAIATGVALGLIHATKETSVVIYAAMGAALVGTVLLDRHSLADIKSSTCLRPSYLAALLFAGVATVVVLFSSFFTHWQGVIDSVLTYVTYADRAEGAGSEVMHDKPWYYYLSLLSYTYREAGPRWSEAFPLALGAVGMVVGLVRGTGIVRFLSLYALLLTAAYAVIPYKTPWNLLVFYQPILILAGCAAAKVTRAMWTQNRTGIKWVGAAIVVAILLAGTGHMARQAWLGNFRYPADVRNPYVYAHTSTALNRLVDRIADLAAVHPRGKELHINIIKPDGDYWPLPWYLRAYPTVGYWVTEPEDPDADIIISDTRLRRFVQENSDQKYQFEFHALRPNVKLHVWIEEGLWDAFMDTRR